MSPYWHACSIRPQLTGARLMFGMPRTRGGDGCQKAQKVQARHGAHEDERQAPIAEVAPRCQAVRTHVAAARRHHHHDAFVAAL